MNCKQGDLAVVIRGHLSGLVLTCVETYVPCNPVKFGICWQVAPKVKGYKGFSDHCLRPLHDNPGQDETLTWLPVPSKEKESV